LTSSADRRGLQPAAFRNELPLVMFVLRFDVAMANGWLVEG
jgi:hypothetical protein